MDARRIHGAMFRSWLADPAYTRMRSFGVSTPYRGDPEYYQAHFERLMRVVGPANLDRKEALIIGPGLSPDEAALVLQAFPGLSKLHLVDWHEQNIEYLEGVFTAWEQDHPEYRKTELHLADAANIESLTKGSVRLVYMHQVIEDLLQDLDYVLDVFREIKRVLMDGGILFTLETKIEGKLESDLYDMGFARVQISIGKTHGDIWRKVG